MDVHEVTKEELLKIPRTGSQVWNAFVEAREYKIS